MANRPQKPSLKAQVQPNELELPEPVAGEKVQKVLARAGLGSRREIERWVEAGRVAVNGKAARLGDRVDDHDRLAAKSVHAVTRRVAARYLGGYLT